MFRNFKKISNFFNNRRISAVINHESVDWANAKPFHEIPGPKPLPIIGNLWRHLPYIGEYGNMNMYDLNLKYNEQYGDIVRISKLFPHPDFILCYNTKDIETIYRTESPAPKHGESFLESIKYFRKYIRPDVFKGIDGIFSSDGQDYIELKAKIYPILRNPNYVSVYTCQIDAVTQELVERIRYLSDRDPHNEMPDDFSNEINKWNFETICHITLDTKLGLFDDNPDPQAIKFLKYNLEFFELLYYINIFPNPWKYISNPRWRRHVKGMNFMTDYIQDKIGIAMDEIKNGKSNQNETFLKNLLKKDETIAFVTSLDLLQGAIDTTGKTAHIILYYLAKYPDKQKILREELRKLMPKPDSPLTPEIIQKMTYLKAVVKEGMRVKPIALGTPRQIEKDLILSGYQIPKNTHVFLCHYALSISDKYFPEPSKFIPERWLRGSKGYEGNRDNLFAYQPFGFGTRSCLGRRLAIVELEILIAKVVRNFEMEWNYDDMKFEAKLLYSVADPLKIKMIPVDN